MNPDRTEAPVEGDATPPPLGFTLPLWMGAFAAMLWGMYVLFNRRTPDRPPPPTDPPRNPHA